ncbi:MAG: hypothetical protein IJ108_05075 [Eubacterium sp.]|nr:hypothetical protein [Eubacterium sp.]
MNGIGGNIFIGVVIAICIAGAILAWRIDNGSSPEDKEDNQVDSSAKEDSDAGEVDD